MVTFIALAIAFWLIQFAYQFYVLIPEQLNGSLVRSFALAGATFIGTALLLSSVFKFRPDLGKYWYVRRMFGVMGFTFAAFHVISVLNFLFQWDVGAIYWSLNPFENPLIFGSLGFPIFFLMFLTSTDWAFEKLGTKWKTIHRLVYFGYWAIVSHFLLINPELLMNLAGYLLLLITFLAITGQLYWFLKNLCKVSIQKFGNKNWFCGNFSLFINSILWVCSSFFDGTKNEC